jgi:PDZ domain-containing protein
MRLRRLLSPGVLLLAGLALAAVTFAVLWLAPSGNYVFLPDRAYPVAPLVSVRGGHEPKGRGGIYFVDIIVRKASLLEDLFPSIRDGATLVPGRALNGGLSDEARRRQDARDMTLSQKFAAAVALQALGYKVKLEAHGVRVDQVLKTAPAARRLKPGDLIVGLNGERIGSVCTLRRLLAREQVGAVVQVAVRRGGQLQSFAVKTIRGSDHPLLGIGAVDSYTMGSLPFPVRIDTHGIGGPSAGLAFTLDLMEQLGRDVDRGLRVAVTGTIEPDGCVDQVGGVKQKTIGARKTKVDVFVVPAGDNAQEARKYAEGVRVVPVQSFRQALHALATLPRKT